jgi:hypothetical protein
MEGGGAPHGGIFVEPQAVDLDRSGVAVAVEAGDRHLHRTIEQPAGGGRPDDDRNRRGESAEGVDDLDLTGGVAEAVAGDEEADGRHHRGG